MTPAHRTLRKGDPGYPQALAGIPRPPEELYVTGALRPEARRVAVVGARALPPQKADWARTAARLLARAGVEVVSGGARGADTAAHEGALEGGGATVAVLAGGPEHAYPRENRGLFQTIVARGGALVTENPPGSAPLPALFPRRNRIVSGLSEAVLVVHAARNSGSLHTAAAARTQGRKLFVVPGGEGNEGAEALVERGQAEPVQSPAAFLAALGLEAPRTASASPGGDEGRVLALLETGPRHLDELAAALKMSPGALFLVLGRLEADHRIVAQPGNLYRRR